MFLRRLNDLLFLILLLDILLLAFLLLLFSVDVLFYNYRLIFVLQCSLQM